jgi:hypothetical protein
MNFILSFRPNDTPFEDGTFRLLLGMSNEERVLGVSSWKVDGCIKFDRMMPNIDAASPSGKRCS